MSLLLSQTGGGRWEAVAVQPHCLDVSRVPGEESTCGCIQRGAMFSQSNAMGERKPAQEMLGDLLFHCQTIINISTCQITLPGGQVRGGGQGMGWIAGLSPEPLHFTSPQCFLLLREHLQGISLVRSHDISGKQVLLNTLILQLSRQRLTEGRACVSETT